MTNYSIIFLVAFMDLIKTDKILSVLLFYKKLLSMKLDLEWNYKRMILRKDIIEKINMTNEKNSTKIQNFNSHLII